MASHGRSGTHDSVMEGQNGPFGYDLNNIQSSITPRNPILDSNDQALMAEFWKSPGAVQPNHTNALSLNGFMVNEKAQISMDNGWLGDGADYSVGLGIDGDNGADSTGGAFPHLGASNYHDMFNFNTIDNSTAQQPESDDQAATALLSMSSDPQQNNSHNNQFAGAWGNINMPPNFFAEQNNTMPSSSTATPTTPTQSHNAQLSRQMQPQALFTHNWVQSSTEKTSSTNPHVRRASSQMDMRQMPAGQQQQWNAPQSPAHNGQGMQFGSDRSFSQQGFQRTMYGMPIDKSGNLLQLGGGTMPSRAGMSFSQTPSGHTPVQQQSGQRMSVPNNLRTLTNAASARPYQQSTTINTQYPNYPGQWPAHSAMNNISQPSRKRSHSESEGQSAAQSIAPPARRGPAVPKDESNDDPSNQNSLITPPGSNKRRRPTITRQDTGSSASSPSTPADATHGAVLKRKRSEPKQSRANLSDAQKRSNHIASEQKRRDAMKTNFAELNTMVPSLHNGTHGLSRSDILQRAADYLENLMNSNQALKACYGVLDAALSEDDDEEEEQEEDVEEDDVGYVARGNTAGVTTFG